MITPKSLLFVLLIVFGLASSAVAQVKPRLSVAPPIAFSKNSNAVYGCLKCKLAYFRSGKCAQCKKPAQAVAAKVEYVCPACKSKSDKKGACPKCKKFREPTVTTWACVKDKQTAAKAGNCPKCKKKLAKMSRTPKASEHTIKATAK